MFQYLSDINKFYIEKQMKKHFLTIALRAAVQFFGKQAK